MDTEMGKRADLELELEFLTALRPAILGDCCEAARRVSLANTRLAFTDARIEYLKGLKDPCAD